MYLRPTPAVVDPAVPGATRRQQISVRPGSKEITARVGANGPPRASGEKSSDRSKGDSRSDAAARRALPSEPPTAPSRRPVGPLPRPVMVVSPVSLTAEELQLPVAGARGKMPTLLGLGMAFDKVPGAPGSADAAASEAAPPPSAASPPPPAEPTPGGNGAPAPAGEDGALVGEWVAFDGPTPPTSLDLPDGIGGSVQLLADFALKLSLGPVSRLWLPAVRRAAEALLVTGRHRQETALATVSARLVELMAEPAAALEPAVPEPIESSMRDQILHEVSRLAGILPEWPAAAQDLSEEARRREARIVRELFVTIDGLRRDHRARLEEQMRLEELTLATAETLADEFETPLERAGELRLVLESYRLERQTREPDVGNSLGLSRALDALERRARDFDDSDPEQREIQRVLRRQRREAMTLVNLLLAERGELEWLELLEPMCVSERVERLREWLDASAEGAG